MPSCQLLALECNTATLGFIDAADAIQEGGLSSAVWADHCSESFFWYVNIYLSKDFQSTE
jgi:hypothetical protein